MDPLPSLYPPSAPLVEPRLPATPVACAASLVYPPVDEGLPVLPVDDLILAQDELIRRFRVVSGSPAEEFDRLYLSVMRRYASYVHLLPATKRDYYWGSGGLMRFGFEVAFGAFQAVEGHLFGVTDTVEVRRANEPRWRYAAFLAALCSELVRPLSEFTVVADNGAVWPIYEMPLLDWCALRGVRNYFVRWNKTALQVSSSGSASYILPLIIPPASLQYLHDGSAQIVVSMMAVVNHAAIPGSNDALASIVRAVRDRLIAKDRAMASERYGTLTVGAHVEPYLLDGIRRLVRNGKWTINQDKSRIWYGRDGMYLVWGPSAKNELLAELGDVRGLPRDDNTLLEMLIAGGVMQRASSGSLMWDIVTDPNKPQKTLRAARFAHPESLLPADEIPRLDFALSALSPAPAPDSSSASTPADTAPPLSLPSSHPPASHHPPGDSFHSSAATAESSDTGAEKAGEADVEDSPYLPDAAVLSPAVPSFESDKARELLDKLPITVAETLRAMIDDAASGAIPRFPKVGKSVALMMDVISGYGVNAIEFGGALFKLGWLDVDPARPERFQMMVDVGGGRSERVFLLKSRKAKELGIDQT